LAEWLAQNGDRTFLSVVTLGELHYGVSRLLQGGSERRATQLQHWIDALLTRYHRRCLPLDLAAAQRTGELLAKAEASGHDPGFEDASLAATADVHRLIVVTFNTRHFRAFGVPFQEPGNAESR
jgi:predicted nucleic acid-binding protein